MGYLGRWPGRLRGREDGSVPNTQGSCEPEHFPVAVLLKIYTQSPLLLRLLQPSLTSLTLLLTENNSFLLPTPHTYISILVALLRTYPVNPGPRHSLTHTEDKKCHLPSPKHHTLLMRVHAQSLSVVSDFPVTQWTVAHQTPPCPWILQPRIPEIGGQPSSSRLQCDPTSISDM